MSCYNCNNCTPTKDMNLCHASINFGSFGASPVTLTFVSNSDGAKFQVSGPTSGGTLTILAANLPPFVHGVGYSVTASETWTLDGEVRDCVTMRFTLVKDADGVPITGTAETLEVCN